MPLGKAEAVSYTDIRDEDRVQIQFRLGAQLIAKIDKAAKIDGCTRNDWLVKACLIKLRGEGTGGAFFADMVSANRLPILFRISSKIRDAIDAEWKSAGISNRTLWIVEAILGHISTYKNLGI